MEQKLPPASGVPQQGQQRALFVAQVAEEAKGVFAENGEEFEEEDAQDLVNEPPSEPNFPQLIFSVALLKDLLDSLDLTVIGTVFTTIGSFLLSIILFLWIMHNAGGGWWKRKIIRMMWRRYALAMVIEYIPFLKIIPSTTILVLTVHYKDKKIVRLFNSALDRAKGKGFK